MAEVDVDVNLDVQGEGKLKDLNEDLGKLDDGAKKGGKDVDQLGDKAGNTGRRLGGLGGVIGGLTAGLGPVGLAGAAAGVAGIVGGKLIGGFLGAGREIQNMSDLTGLSATKFQELTFAAEQNGATADDVKDTFIALSERIGEAAEGTGEGAEVFNALGLSWQVLSRVSPERQLDLVADALANVDDPTKRLELTTRLLSTAGENLLPVLSQGSEGIAAYGEQAHSAGAIMSDETIGATKGLSETVGILQSSFGSIVTNILTSLLPAFIGFANFLKDTAVPFIRDTVIPILKQIVEVGFDGIVTAVRDYVIPGLKELFNIVFPIVKTLWDETLKPTIDSIIAIFSGDGDGEGDGSVTGALNVLKRIFEGVWDAVKLVVETVVGVIVERIEFVITTVKGIIDFLVNIFKGDWQGAWDAIEDIFEGFWDFIKDTAQIALDFVKGIFDIFGVDIEGIVGGIWGKVRKKISDGWDAVKSGARSVVRFFKDDVWGGIKTAANTFLDFFKVDIPNGFKTAVNAIIGFVEAIPNAFIEGVNAIIRAWNDLSISIPPIKVKIPIIGEKEVFGGLDVNTPNLPTVPKVSIPRLAEGGVVTRPTLALVGEAGPEAVIPLNRAGAGTTVVVNFNGNVSDRASFRRDVKRAVNEGVRRNQIGLGIA